MKQEYEYATLIAGYIWAKCYKQESPEWAPLSELMGVLSQIDNMVCGMTCPQQTNAKERGFIQGIVYACGFLAADHHQESLAVDLWNESGLSKEDVKVADEYDVAKFRKAIPDLAKGQQ